MGVCGYAGGSVVCVSGTGNAAHASLYRYRNIKYYRK